ncbi:hypothetical protein [Sorangium sp. So ce131]|uniref:hypothetical protein n=1 Tax=Sorangium sp. So ce131 TaxID=3133282 RepID=UPI003F5FE91C
MRTCGARPGVLLTFATASALLLGAAGCAIPVRASSADPEVARSQTPAAIDAAIEKMDEAETKRRLERMMASPEMRAAQRQLIAGLIDGTLASLSEADRAARINALTTQYMRGVVQSAMDGALDGALSEDGKRELSRFTGSLLEVSVRQLKESLDEVDVGPSVSAALREQLGPALQVVIAENLGPGMTSVLGSEDFQRALGATARVLGREMVAGANEALVEIQQRSGRSQGESTLSRLGDLADGGAQLVDMLSWFLGAVAVALGAWVAVLLVQRKRYRAETEQQARTRLLMEALEASEGKPWSEELLSALEERFRAEQEVDGAVQIRRARQKLYRASAQADGVDRPPPRSSIG